MNRQYDFTAKQAQYAAYTDASILYALKDAVEARDASATHDTQAEGYYADDVHTLSQVARARGLR